MTHGLKMLPMTLAILFHRRFRFVETVLTRYPLRYLERLPFVLERSLMLDQLDTVIYGADLYRRNYLVEMIEY